MSLKVGKQASVAAARAEGAFAFYYALGPSRSLRELHARLAEIGLATVGEKSLRRWSSLYGWQARVARLDEELRAKRDAQAVDAQARHIAEMNARQANLGRALQAVAVRGMQALDPAEIGAPGASMLAREGVRIERLAEGESTERQEIVHRLYGMMLQEVLAIARRAVAYLPIEDQHRVLEGWARDVDALAERRLPQLASGKD